MTRDRAVDRHGTNKGIEYGARGTVLTRLEDPASLSVIRVRYVS